MRKYDLKEYSRIIQKQMIFEIIKKLKKGDCFIFITEVGEIKVKQKKKNFIFELNKKEIEQTKLNNLLSRTEPPKVKKQIKRYKIENNSPSNTVLISTLELTQFYSKKVVEDIFEFRQYKKKRERKNLYKDLPEVFNGYKLIEIINKHFNFPPPYDIFTTFEMLKHRNGIIENGNNTGKRNKIKD